MPKIAIALRTLHNKDFRRLWVAQIISALGDRIVDVAIIFAVLELTGHASDVGVVLAALIIPRVVLTIVGGVLGDRFPRKLIMVGSNLVRAVAQLLVAVLSLTHRLELWHLVSLSLVYGFAAAFFGPAFTGLIAQTAGRDRAQEANALMKLATSTIGVLGPAVGGFLVAWSSPSTAFLIDGISFLVNAGLLMVLTTPPVELKTSTFLYDLREGWREVVSRRWLWMGLTYFSLWNLAIGPMFVLGPVVAQRDLGGAQAWGIITTGGAIGMIVGSLLALRLRVDRLLATAFGGLLVSGLQSAALAVPLPVTVLVATSAVTMAMMIAGNVWWETALIQNVPNHVLSRVSAYEYIGSFVFLPVGYLIAGPISDLLGVGNTLLLTSGTMTVLTVAILSFKEIWTLRRYTSAEVEDDRLMNHAGGQAG